MVDTVRLGAAGMGGEAKRGVFGERVLEGDGARQHAAVKLGQHHMHGEVGRPKPARALLPGSAPRGRDHRLQHRRVDRVERRRLAGAAGGECRGGDDDRWGKTLKRAADKLAGLLVLQARDYQRRGRKPACRQRLASASIGAVSPASRAER